MVFGFIGPIGWNELVIILVIVLVIFGPKRLPEFADALGKSIRKFKAATREAQDEITSSVSDKPPTDKKPD
jgi:sec-independent protein translocase protein TatA